MMIDLSVGSMSKDELNLPEGLKMSLIWRHTLNIFKTKNKEEEEEETHVGVRLHISRSIVN